MATIEINNYSVIYNTNDFEIEGKLIPYNNGRTKEYKFEPDTFSNIETENYYSDNWEEIEENILKYFWNNKRK